MDYDLNYLLEVAQIAEKFKFAYRKVEATRINYDGEPPEINKSRLLAATKELDDAARRFQALLILKSSNVNIEYEQSKK